MLNPYKNGTSTHSAPAVPLADFVIPGPLLPDGGRASIDETPMQQNPNRQGLGLGLSSFELGRRVVGAIVAVATEIRENQENPHTYVGSPDHDYGVQRVPIVLPDDAGRHQL